MEFKIKDKQVFFCLNKLDDYMSGHKGFIAGGAFKNLFNGYSSDFDVLNELGKEIIKYVFLDLDINTINDTVS
jgi:hypothetical protein